MIVEQSNFEQFTPTRSNPANIPFFLIDNKYVNTVHLQLKLKMKVPKKAKKVFVTNSSPSEIYLMFSRKKNCEKKLSHFIFLLIFMNTFYFRQL